MIKLVALTGPMYSGKTTLAKELESKHGYRIANFTDHLKQLAANAISLYSRRLVTLDDIKANKADYRVFLQEFGRHIGYNYDPVFVVSVVKEVSFNHLSMPIVFDNVRTESQAATLRGLGFRIVQLQIDMYTQIHRAQSLGVQDADTLQHITNHEAERGIANADLILEATVPASVNANIIVNTTLSS